ncbi:type II secretion system minor pseudopilin GspI [Aquisalinus flavus]|nr:type II secretion system minor pseudopilin GspI [Aquisalinus flavus]MBD0427324.1 type II secretion system minor pseudopilin GspI [Aquisalinus flavus]
MTRHASPQCGFTLTEVLIAMAILSTAIAGALVLMTNQVSAAGDIERRLVAGIVAENVLVEAMASPAPPDLGTETGVEQMGGTDWAWSRVTAETPVESMVRISVDVREEGGEQVIRSLTAFKAVQ